MQIAAITVWKNFSKGLEVKLRYDYLEFFAVVIDEISVVPNIRLPKIHKRVNIKH